MEPFPILSGLAIAFTAFKTLRKGFPSTKSLQTKRFLSDDKVQFIKRDLKRSKSNLRCKKVTQEKDHK